MISDLIKSRSFIISAALIVIALALTIVVVCVNTTKSDFELNQLQQQMDNPGITTYSSTNINDATDNSIVAGKKWVETTNGVSKMIAEASSGYVFAYWLRSYSSVDSKISGKDTISVTSSQASSFTPVFVPNSRVKDIATLADFTTYYNNANFDILRLTSDIDATGISYTPVSSFSKVLDGAGYSIHNLSIETTSQTTCGALAQTLNGGVIKNLALEACSITDITSPTAANLGGFVGTITNGLISNCVMASSVKSTKSVCNVGAFVGTSTGNMDTSFIDNCIFSGSVMGASVGAIICDNANAACVLTNNKSTGSLYPIAS